MTQPSPRSFSANLTMLLSGCAMGLALAALPAGPARAQVAAFPMLGSLVQAGQAIAAGGSEAQRAEWLPQIISGDLIAGYFHDVGLQSQGDRLTGGSRFVTHGGSADPFVVTDTRQVWIVRADAPGIRIDTQTSMDQTRPFAHVQLKDVPGEPLPGAAAALAAAHRAAFIAVAAEALGGAQACLDRTVAYSKERIQFGRPIGSFQAYKHRLADMMIEIEQARSAVYWAACAVDEGSDEAAMAIHAAKSFAARSCRASARRTKIGSRCSTALSSVSAERNAPGPIVENGNEVSAGPR